MTDAERLAIREEWFKEQMGRLKTALDKRDREIRALRHHESYLRAQLDALGWKDPNLTAGHRAKLEDPNHG